MEVVGEQIFRGAEATVESLFKRLAGTVKTTYGGGKTYRKGVWGRNL